jgi:hypothetical protein
MIAVRRVGALLVAGLGLAAAAGAQTAYPIFTPDHLDATMKTLGPNVAGVHAAIRAGDMTLAKERAIRSREQLATTITFWRDRGRDDAVRILRVTLRAFDTLDTALSQTPADPAAVDAANGTVGVGCTACHAIYRQGEDGDYRLNEAALR